MRNLLSTLLARPTAGHECRRHDAASVDAIAPRHAEPAAGEIARTSASASALCAVGSTVQEPRRRMPIVPRRIIMVWSVLPRCGCCHADAVSSRLSGRAGHQDPRRGPAARASRSSSSSRAGRWPDGFHDAGISVTVGDPAACDYLRQGRPHPEHLRHHRRQRQAQPQENPRGGARRRRHAGLRARHRPEAPTSAPSEFHAGVSRRRLPHDGRAVRPAAAHRVRAAR